MRLITASGERCGWPFFIFYIDPFRWIDFSTNPAYNDQRFSNALPIAGVLSPLYTESLFIGDNQQGTINQPAKRFARHVT